MDVIDLISDDESDDSSPSRAEDNRYSQNASINSDNHSYSEDGNLRETLLVPAVRNLENGLLCESIDLTSDGEEDDQAVQKNDFQTSELVTRDGSVPAVAAGVSTDPANGSLSQVGDNNRYSENGSSVSQTLAAVKNLENLLAEPVGPSPQANIDTHNDSRGVRLSSSEIGKTMPYSSANTLINEYNSVCETLDAVQNLENVLNPSESIDLTCDGNNSGNNDINSGNQSLMPESPGNSNWKMQNPILLPVVSNPGYFNGQNMILVPFSPHAPPGYSNGQNPLLIPVGANTQGNMNGQNQTSMPIITTLNPTKNKSNNSRDKNMIPQAVVSSQKQILTSTFPNAPHNSKSKGKNPISKPGTPNPPGKVNGKSLVLVPIRANAPGNSSNGQNQILMPVGHIAPGSNSNGQNGTLMPIAPSTSESNTSMQNQILIPISAGSNINIQNPIFLSVPVVSSNDSSKTQFQKLTAAAPNGQTRIQMATDDDDSTTMNTCAGDRHNKGQNDSVMSPEPDTSNTYKTNQYQTDVNHSQHCHSIDLTSEEENDNCEAHASNQSCDSIEDKNDGPSTTVSDCHHKDNDDDGNETGNLQLYIDIECNEIENEQKLCQNEDEDICTNVQDTNMCGNGNGTDETMNFEKDDDDDDDDVVSYLDVEFNERPAAENQSCEKIFEKSVANDEQKLCQIENEEDICIDQKDILGNGNGKCECDEIVDDAGVESYTVNSDNKSNHSTTLIQHDECDMDMHIDLVSPSENSDTPYDSTNLMQGDNDECEKDVDNDVVSNTTSSENVITDVKNEVNCTENGNKPHQSTSLMHEDVEYDEDTDDVKHFLYDAENADIWNDDSQFEKVGPFSESSGKTFECKFCSSVFQNLFKYKRHMYTHTGERPWTCDTCHFPFPSEYQLTTHKKEHERNISYKCDLCAKVFPRRKRLVVHLGKHKRGRKWSCDECSRAFYTKGELATHKQRHTGIRPFKCAHCDRTFFNNVTLNAHQKWHLEQNQKEKNQAILFYCEVCDREFLTAELFDKHNQSKVHHHNSKKKTLLPNELKCSECYQLFTEECHLIEHRKIHELRKCDVCGDSFTNLQRHKKTHPGQLPYSCKMCDETFSSHSDWKAHMRSHPGAALFQCKTCGAGFQWKGYLKKHEKIHDEKNQKVKDQGSSEGTKNNSSHKDTTVKSTSDITTRNDSSHEDATVKGTSEVTKNNKSTLVLDSATYRKSSPINTTIIKEPQMKRKIPEVTWNFIEIKSKGTGAKTQRLAVKETWVKIGSSSGGSNVFSLLKHSDEI